MKPIAKNYYDKDAVSNHRKIRHFHAGQRKAAKRRINQRYRSTSRLETSI